MILILHATADRRKQVSLCTVHSHETKRISPMLLTWNNLLNASVQKKWPPILEYSQLKKKEDKKTNKKKRIYSPYQRRYCFLKTAWVRLYTRRHGTSTEHLGQINPFLFPPLLSTPPTRGHSDCQCSEAKTFSKAVWVNKNTLYTSGSEYWKIGDDKTFLSRIYFSKRTPFMFLCSKK